MDRNIWIFLVLCLAFLVWLVFFSGPPEETPSTIVETPTPEPENRGGESKDVISAASRPSAQAVRAEVTPTSRPLGGVAIDLMDALGDPIPNGVVEVASQIYRSDSSHFNIADISEGTHAVLAAAEGFQSASAAIRIPASQCISITLEYEWECEIEVQRELVGTRPVEGAEVLLYEGPSVPRPVERSIHIVTRRDASGSSTLRLARQDVGVYVTGVRGKPGAAWFSDQVKAINRDPSLRRGDRVVGFNVQPQRIAGLARSYSRLRLWDSLAALCSTTDDLSPVGTLALARGNASLSVWVYGQKPSREGQLARTSFTDAKGRCRFERLPPGVYFAQARKKDSRTDVYTACPADPFVNLILKEPEESIVQVTVRVASLSDHSKERIEGAEVQLRGLQRFVLVSGITDRAGRATLRPVPWGKYVLTVTAPEHFNANPRSKQMEVVVESPSTNVEVELTADFGVTVSGRVLRADSNEPVPGYPLRLKRNRFSGSTSDGRFAYGEYASGQSDSGGRFQFTHVIPGDYLLTGHTVQEGQTDFLPSHQAVSNTNETQEHNGGLRIRVAEKAIENLSYFVTRTVRSILMGKVMTADRQPVADAKITLDDLEGFVESGDRSKQDGSFRISVVLPESDHRYESVITASVKERPVERFRYNFQGEVVREYEDSGVVAEATVSVTFRGGETVQGIQLILSPVERGHVLTGRITTGDGRVPERVQFLSLKVWQEHEDHPEKWGDTHILRAEVWVEPDGEYRVDRLKPGPFRHDISHSIPLNIYESITLPPPVVYASQKIELEMPADKNVIEYDIVLKEKGYIHGRVVDQNAEPMSDVGVMAIPAETSTTTVQSPGNSPKMRERPGDMSSTGKDGSFLLFVLPDRKYTLSVTSKETQQMYASQIHNLQPPIQDLILQVNKEETLE